MTSFIYKEHGLHIPYPLTDCVQNNEDSVLKHINAVSEILIDLDYIGIYDKYDETDKNIRIDLRKSLYSVLQNLSRQRIKARMKK